MIWNSTFLMTLIDILIILAVLYLAAIFYRYYKASKRLGLTRGINFILFGLSATALFYLTDLLTMHVLPSAMSHEYAMVVMRDLHLNWSWGTALISMGTIAIGLSYLIRVLIPKATSSVENLEQQVQERTAKSQREIDERKLVEEEALRLPEQQLSLIYDSIGDVLYYLKVEPGPHYRFLSVNSAFLKATGLAMEQIIDKTINEVIPESSLQLVRSNYEKAIREKRIVHWEETSQYPAGLKTGIVSIAPILDDKGNCTHLVGSVHDITERKQVEKTLLESEKKYRSAINALDEGVVYQLADGSIQTSNKSAQRILGLTADQMLGRTSLDPRWRSIHEDGSPFPGETHPMVHTLRTGEPTSNVIMGIHQPTGELRWISINCNALFHDGENLPYAAVGSFTDITDRKQAEEKLKTLSVAIEQNPAVVMITDPKGNIEYVNRAFCELTGYSAEEALGKNPRILQSGKTPKEFYEELWKTILASKEWRGEFHNKKKNGEFFWEDASISAIHDDNGNITHFIGLKKDITERKRLEVEKANLEAQLHRAQKLETIGTLAGGIAHDFNNILTPIMGYADMALSDLPSNNSLRKDLEHILKGANRAKELVEQILLFSRQIEKERQQIGLHLILKEALKLLRPSIPTTIEIRQQIDTSCDKVLADATQMHEVVVNLCTNAWQAMEGKGGVLTIELKQLEVDAATAKSHANLKEGEYVRLTVSDTGAGMDDATLARIFEPFFTTKPVDKGTGMGLSVVHGIVRSHHGDILVSSEPGKGSTFHLYLPVVSAEAEISKKAPGAIQGGHEFILVVDDEKSVAKVVQKMLKRLGYKVDLCDSSLATLKTFRQQPNRYDLVISDLTMPNMTGLVLSEQLQKIRPGLPIVIMTGYGESLPKDILKHYGIHEVIGKPIVMRELAPTIRAVLDK